MVRLIFFILLAFGFSCTIIEDGDITSQEELDHLVYSSFEIDQETVTGNKTTVATLLYDSVRDFVDQNGAGVHIKREVRYSLSSLGDLKLKFRGGSTGATTLTIRYNDADQPATFFIKDENDSTPEFYRFKYDAQNRLIIINTFIDPADDGLPVSEMTSDTFTYGTNGRISNLARIGSEEGAISDFTHYTSGSSYYLFKFNYQGLMYEGPCQGGSGCGAYWGGNYDVSPQGTGTQFPNGVMNLTVQGENLGIQDVNYIDPSFCTGGSGSGCGDAWIDLIYFHPLMLLRNQFDQGDDLLFIYMIDWWQPSSAVESTENEKVTFTFKYDL